MALCIGLVISVKISLFLIFNKPVHARMKYQLGT